MASILNYIRELFNWTGIEQPRKRRANFEYEFPSISSKIRRISHMDSPAGYKKERIIPIKMVDSISGYPFHHENKPRPPKTWNSTAKENYIEISDDEEDDVRVVEDHRLNDKTREYYEDNKRKPTIWFDKNHVEVEEDKDDDDDDVLYVTCIESNESKAKRMGYKFFKTREHDSPIILKTIENKSGIFRPAYKKISRPIPRSKYAINESYRLDDKIKYRELLKKVAPHFGSSPEYSASKRHSSLFGTPLSLSVNSDNRSRSRRLVEAALRAHQEKEMPSIDLTEEDFSPHFSLFNKFKSDINYKSSPILINGNGEASSSPKHSLKEYTTPSPVTVKDSSDSEIECIGAVSADNSKNVQKVNSLKATLEMKPVCSPKYIQELKEKYAKVFREKERKIEEEECRKKLHSEHNKKIFGTALEERIKRSLIISEPIEIIEDSLEAEPFPTFTSDQETMIKRALCPGPSGQVLAQKFRMNITRGDLHTLSGLNWLNDEIINFYMNLIMERGNQDGKLKVYATNTFFYPKLMSGGHQSLRRWTRKVDIFAHDLMLVPIHLDVHWCMTVIDFRDKSIRYYDSMGGHLKQCVEALLQYLIDEKMDKKKEKFDKSGWVMPVAKDLPQQMNGSDCGVFSCTFAEFASRDAKFTFSQKDMPYLRRKMVYEILTGRLLMG